MGPVEKEQRKRMCLTFNFRNIASSLDGGVCKYPSFLSLIIKKEYRHIINPSSTLNTLYNRVDTLLHLKPFFSFRCPCPYRHAPPCQCKTSQHTIPDDLARRDNIHGLDNSISAGIASSGLLASSSAPVNIPGSPMGNSISGSFQSFLTAILSTAEN